MEWKEDAFLLAGLKPRLILADAHKAEHTRLRIPSVIYGPMDRYVEHTVFSDTRWNTRLNQTT
jgi:hypothetical protein